MSWLPFSIVVDILSGGVMAVDRWGVLFHLADELKILRRFRMAPADLALVGMLVATSPCAISRPQFRLVQG